MKSRLLKREIIPVFVTLRTLNTVAILAGAALPLAFAPCNWWWLAILSPAALLWVWQDAIIFPGQAFSLGLLYGLGMFGVGVSWVFVSIYWYGKTNIPISAGITLLLVLLLASFIATQGYLLKRFFRGSSTTFWLLGFPSSWVLFEWIRGWLFTGFPWLYLGYTQIDSPLSGYAPIFSVYGVSTAVALTSGALITLLNGRRNAKIIACLVLALVWSMGFLLKTQEYTTAYPQPFTVSLVQGNIEPFDKFTQQDPIRSVERSYGTLTQDAWGSDLILWPESAIPEPLPPSQPFVDDLTKVAAEHHSTLITGVQFVNENGEFHNSLIALGDGRGIYHKYHLLPFGDYVPFEQWLRGLIHFFDLPMSSFVPGPEQQNLISAGPLLLDPLICYEIAFPEQVRETLRNANAIITLSEDGWFGSSWGPHQHLQIAQMRALETGRYVLRSTTSGITAIIDPKGNLTATAPQFQATVLKGTFQSMNGETPWVKIGLLPLLISLLLAFVLPGSFKKSYRRP